MPATKSVADVIKDHLVTNWALGTVPKFEVTYETVQVHEPTKNTVRVAGAKGWRAPAGKGKENEYNRVRIYVHSPTDGLAEDFATHIRQICVTPMPAGVDFAYFRDVEDTSERAGKVGLFGRYQYTLELMLECHSLTCGSASPIVGFSSPYWADLTFITVDDETAKLAASVRLQTALGAFSFDLVPDITNTRSAGNTSKRIKKIWTVDLDISGTITGGDLHPRLHSLTDVLDHSAGNYKVFYSDGSAHVQELALGASGTYLKSQGPATAPAFDTPSADQHTVPSAGGIHTGSGLTTGHTLRVTGATTFDWAQLQHTDLGGVSVDQHHTEVHEIQSAGGKHSASGLTTGHVLTATGSTSFAFQTPPAATLPDPIDEAQVWTMDFLSGSTETGEVGEDGWSFTNGSMTVANNEQNHPGIISRQTGTTTAQICSLYPSNAGTVLIFRFDEFQEMTVIICPSTVDSGYGMRVGLTSDATSATPVSCAYFERLYGDTNWYRVTRAASTQTRVDTGTAFAASWIKFRIVKDGSTVKFYINDSLNGTNDTNIMADSVGVLPFLHLYLNGTTAKSCKIDLIQVKLAAVTR